LTCSDIFRSRESSEGCETEHTQRDHCARLLRCSQV
jgi:hypothetical protein